MVERLRASGGSGQSDRNKDSNPFSHNSHGNPAFTPQKVSKGSNLVSKRHEEWIIPNSTFTFIELNAKNFCFIFAFIANSLIQRHLVRQNHRRNRWCHTWDIRVACGITSKPSIPITSYGKLVKSLVSCGVSCRHEKDKNTLMNTNKKR